MRNKTNLKLHNKISVAALAAFTLAGATAHAITIETVPVGNVGNAADTTGYGAVGYSYNIGKYEVTNAQYAAFLNAVAATDTYGLYNTSMGSDLRYGGISRAGSSGSYSYAPKGGRENMPVNFVSFWDATRFANWLNNGQANASTETGSYSLGGATNPVNSSVTRNPGANWVIASENEWYKAAYYDPIKNSGAGGYWLYPTQSDVLGNNTAFTATNGANYEDGDYANGGLNGPGTTNVGTYVNADSFYGTFDQGGNLWEWNETVIDGSFRGLRGGEWSAGGGALRSLRRDYLSPDTSGSFDLGFRVAYIVPAAIPEPSTFGAVFGMVALALGMMRRRKTRDMS